MTPDMKEIAMQAYSTAYILCKEKGRQGGVGDDFWVTVAMATLAELLLKDCIKTITDIKTTVKLYEETAVLSFVEDSIKNKFGVQ